MIPRACLSAVAGISWGLGFTEASGSSLFGFSIGFLFDGIAERSAGILPAWSRDGSATLQCCYRGTDFPVRDLTGWKTRSHFVAARSQI
jgi:hypothetical protein